MEAMERGKAAESLRNPLRAAHRRVRPVGGRLQLYDALFADCTEAWSYPKGGG